ncbi:hypothetical protein FE257_000386 [Aspergillus nanangensis]|uniref:Uncharacterized protein n=1 Tax=Aspergillus nanangensis TaxID=2582783 RepID=A0AAD4GXB0_ASPNN|nr:hypothetical protein FE257_000386 [Aspergillus nanangensis]
MKTKLPTLAALTTTLLLPPTTLAWTFTWRGEDNIARITNSRSPKPCTQIQQAQDHQFDYVPETQGLNFYIWASNDCSGDIAGYSDTLWRKNASRDFHSYLVDTGDSSGPDSTSVLSMTTAARTSTSTSATSSTSTSTSTSTSPPEDRSGGGGGGISGGAIAGIVVGVVAAVAILGAAFFILGRRRRGKKAAAAKKEAAAAAAAAAAADDNNNDNNPGAGAAGAADGTAELQSPLYDQYKDQFPPEKTLYEKVPVELPGNQAAAEMSNTHAVVEMSTSRSVVEMSDSQRINELEANSRPPR